MQFQWIVNQIQSEMRWRRWVNDARENWKSGPIDCKNVRMKDRPRFKEVSKERTQQQNNMGSFLAHRHETMPLSVTTP